jgi:hypothetical protein
MSGPDEIDERFGTLVGELRSGETAASPELRQRVRAIVTREPEPPARRIRARLPRRRIVFALVPVCALVGVAVGLGIVSSSGSKPSGTVLGQLEPFKRPLPSAGSGRAPIALPPTARASAAPAPSGSRAQIYSADLRLSVSDLSGRTKDAIRLTRGWGGYVVTVDYGSGQKSGEAYLVVRIPVVNVQTAIARLTALGTILADHVSIQDIQGQLNLRYSRMADLRAQIASLRAKLTDTSLTRSQRAFFEAAIATRQATLAKLLQQQTAQKTRAGLATVALDLETRKAAVSPPSKPGRVGQALDDIGRVLVVEAEILLYVLLIGAPFVALALLVWVTRRSCRRRSEEQLLAR